MIAIASYLLWRLWKFSIRPALYPNDPKEIPYLVPFIGHLLSFFMDFNGSVGRGIRYMGSNREPFAMSFMGKTVYIVSNPKDVADSYRNQKNFSRDTLTKEMYARVGVPWKVADRLFTVDPNASYNANQVKLLHPTDIMMEFYHQHIFPGDRFEEFMSETILPGLDRDMDFDAAIPHPAELRRHEESITVSLGKLCVHVFVQGFAEAYYGPKLWEIEPDFINLYLVWEKINWKFLFNTPAFMSRDMLEAKKALVNLFVEYFKIPVGERQSSNFFVISMENSLREANLTDDEIGCIFMLQTWGILANMYKTSFWLLSYLVHDSALLESIRSEILPATQKNRIDHRYLTEHCPYLDSVFNEAMRLTMRSPLVRNVSETAVLGGKTLRSGNMVMVPYRHLHLDSAAWGPTSEDFQGDRFLRDKTLKTSLSYRPWGGGSTMCTGRHLAKKAIFAFVALLLSRFDVGLETKQSFPRADFSKPSPGIVSIGEHEDAILTLHPRAK